MVASSVGVVLGGFLLVGLPFALVGGAWVRRGVGRVRERQQLQAEAMDTVSSVQAEQRAKLVGVVEAAEGVAPFDSGFAGVPALAAQYVVVEARPDGDGGTDERQVYEDSRTVACELTDDTGNVLVAPDPETVDASGAHHESIRVGKGDEPPEQVKRFLRATRRWCTARMPVTRTRTGADRRCQRRPVHQLLRRGVREQEPALHRGLSRGRVAVAGVAVRRPRVHAGGDGRVLSRRSLSSAEWCGGGAEVVW
jgi:hypothetical protein